MCRHMGYVGSPVTLNEVLLEPRHGLVEQAWAPRDMRGGGTVNADGFGVGWYPQPSASPTRYRNAVPMWNDASFAVLAGQIRTHAVVATVRAATPGMPLTATACAPFTDGRWLFSLNGRVVGWPESLVKAAEQLDVVDLMTLEAPVDSAVVWALVRHRLQRSGDPVAAMCDTLNEVVAAAPGSRMNLLLTDGEMLVATTWTHSLSVRKEEHAVTVASEPFGDDSAWQSVPDRHLVVADARRVSVTALPERGPR